MAEDRALIEKRDSTRRAYKKILNQLLKIIDRDFKFFDDTEFGLKDKVRIEFINKAKQYIKIVDKIDNINDQIVLFDGLLFVVGPSVIGGFTGGRKYSVKIIREIMQKNSQAARTAAHEKKTRDMKDIK